MIKFVCYVQTFSFIITYNILVIYVKYYIIKKDDTLDKILKNYGITYQKFISLNNGNIKDLFVAGNKIVIDNNENNRSVKEDINKIYQSNNDRSEDEVKYLCPHCKNIILIPKQ